MTCSIERTLVLKIQMQIDANQERAVVISKEERKGSTKFKIIMMRAGMTMWRRFEVVCVLLKNKGQEEFRTLGLV